MSITRKPFGIFRYTFAYTLILTTSSPRDCEMAFITGQGFAECQILKKWNGPISKIEQNCDEILHIYWYWQDDPKRMRNDIYHLSRLCWAPNSTKVKMALSLELSGILWWNFAYTLTLTRCSPRDCQISFGIGRGFVEVQILKKVNLAPSLEPFGIFW